MIRFKMVAVPCDMMRHGRSISATARKTDLDRSRRTGGAAADVLQINCLDLKTGGEFSCVMNGPDGEQFENIGVFLEIEPMRRLVQTDAFIPGWIPSARAFIVAETLFEGAGEGRTRYTARSIHWDEAALKEHVRMGFHDGWGKTADQLEALARSL